MKLIRLVLVALPLFLAAACGSDPLAPEAQDSPVAAPSGPSFGAGMLGSGS